MNEEKEEGPIIMRQKRSLGEASQSRMVGGFATREGVKV